MDGEIINMFDALSMLGHDDTQDNTPAATEKQTDSNLKPTPTLNTRSCGLIANEVAEWLEGQQFNPRWMACSAYIDRVRSGLPLPCCTAPAANENVPLANENMPATAAVQGQTLASEDEDTLARLASLILLGSTVTINQPIDSTAAETLAPDQRPTQYLQPQLISALEMHSIARDAQKVRDNRQTPGPSIAPLWPPLLEREREEVWADQVTRQRIHRHSISALSTARAPASLAGRQSFMACVAPRPAARKIDSLFQTLAKDLSGEDHDRTIRPPLEERQRRALEVLGIGMDSKPAGRPLAAATPTEKRPDMSQASSPAWQQQQQERHIQRSATPASGGHFILPRTMRSFSLPLNFVNASEHSYRADVGTPGTSATMRRFTRRASPQLSCVDETPPPSVSKTPNSSRSRVANESPHMPLKVAPADDADPFVTATDRIANESTSPTAAEQRPTPDAKNASGLASWSITPPATTRRLSQFSLGQFARRWSLGKARR